MKKEVDWDNILWAIGALLTAFGAGCSYSDALRERRAREAAAKKEKQR